MVLAVEVGLNDPQFGSLPQVTDQLARAFWGPLVMVAAIPAVLPGFCVPKVAGGVKPGVNVTTIGGVVEF